MIKIKISDRKLANFATVYGTGGRIIRPASIDYRQSDLRTLVLTVSYVEDVTSLLTSRMTAVAIENNLEIDVRRLGLSGEEDEEEECVGDVGGRRDLGEEDLGRKEKDKKVTRPPRSSSVLQSLLFKRCICGGATFLQEMLGSGAWRFLIRITVPEDPGYIHPQNQIQYARLFLLTRRRAMDHDEGSSSQMNRGEGEDMRNVNNNDDPFGMNEGDEESTDADLAASINALGRWKRRGLAAAARRAEATDENRAAHEEAEAGSRPSEPPSETEAENLTIVPVRPPLLVQSENADATRTVIHLANLIEYGTGTRTIWREQLFAAEVDNPRYSSLTEDVAIGDAGVKGAKSGACFGCFAGYTFGAYEWWSTKGAAQISSTTASSSTASISGGGAATSSSSTSASAVLGTSTTTSTSSTSSSSLLTKLKFTLVHATPHAIGPAGVVGFLCAFYGGVFGYLRDVIRSDPRQAEMEDYTCTSFIDDLAAAMRNPTGRTLTAQDRAYLGIGNN
ncbi:unnamed protein product [Amoebophrya sp. A25]|nr:unnamed protein product [Amoebophrya sp. A25]|eukprot:GSA25T00026243001.1